MSTLAERTESLLQKGPSRVLQALPPTAFLVDIVALLIAASISIVGRATLWLFDDSVDVTSQVLPLAPALIAGWVFVLALGGGYRKTIFGDGPHEFRTVFHASFYAIGLVGMACYLGKLDLSRGFYVLFALSGLIAIQIGRTLLRKALHLARAKGSLLHHAVIAGGEAQIDDIAAVLRRERWLGYRLVGALTPGGVRGDETRSGIPILGDAESHEDLTNLAGVDFLFFTGGTSRSAGELRRVVWELEQRDIQLVMAPAMTDFAADRVRSRPVGGLPLIHIESPRWEHASRWAKRSFDLIGSGLLILACSPLLIFAALSVKSNDRGPVFFRQTRTGRDGNEFGCFKFRTMVVDAEARLAQLQADQGPDAKLFKMKDDPRITKPGKWMRRFSVDELPQLFNVFIGDMSLVGPRPPLPSEVAEYDTSVARRLRVRPGMTGLWQVSGRSDLPWEEAVRLDLYYVDNWSLRQDISILRRTVGAVFSSRGAY